MSICVLFFIRRCCQKSSPMTVTHTVAPCCRTLERAPRGCASCSSSHRSIESAGGVCNPSTCRSSEPLFLFHRLCPVHSGLGTGLRVEFSKPRVEDPQSLKCLSRSLAAKNHAMPDLHVNVALLQLRLGASALRSTPRAEASGCSQCYDSQNTGTMTVYNHSIS